MKPCRASFRFLGPGDDTIPERPNNTPLGDHTPSVSILQVDNAAKPRAGRRASSAFNSPSTTPLDSATNSAGVTPALSSLHETDDATWNEIQGEAAILIKAAKRQALRRRSRDLGLNPDEAQDQVREDDPFWIDNASTMRRRSSSRASLGGGSQHLRSRSRSSSTHLGEDLCGNLSESEESSASIPCSRENDRMVGKSADAAKKRKNSNKDALGGCEVLKVSLDIPRTYSWCN